MSELKVRPYTMLPSGQCYDRDEVDKVIAEKDAEILRLTKNWNLLSKNWNRLCEKYNKFIKLKQEFCDKFKDIELEITK